MGTTARATRRRATTRAWWPAPSSTPASTRRATSCRGRRPRGFRHRAPRPQADGPGHEQDREALPNQQPARPAERRDNLYDAREDLAETSSLSGPPPRRTSFLLEAQMNPLGPAGIMVGAAALLAGAAFGMYTLRRPKPLPQRLAARARRHWRRWRRRPASAASATRPAASPARWRTRRPREGHQAACAAEKAHPGSPTAPTRLPGPGRRRNRRRRPGRGGAREWLGPHAHRPQRGSSTYDDARDRGRTLRRGAGPRARGLRDRPQARGRGLRRRARPAGACSRARDRARNSRGRPPPAGDLQRRPRPGRGRLRGRARPGWTLFGRARQGGEEADEAKRAAATIEDAEDRGWP